MLQKVHEREGAVNKRTVIHHSTKKQTMAKLRKIHKNTRIRPSSQPHEHTLYRAEHFHR